MQTTYELALNEFRDASAAVRRAFGAVAEARELQILADSQHKAASQAHADAVARLERADAALMQARDVSQAEAARPEQAAPRVTQADIDAIEPRPNGSIDAHAAGIAIG